MRYDIQPLEKRHIAGFHLVGPWDVKVKQGFEQLSMWVQNNQIQPLEWICVYYDNPENIPPDKLRCNVAITVDSTFQIPANSEGVILTEVPGGQYAVSQVRVYNEAFSLCWNRFFDALLRDSTQHIAAGPCFELYLNDGQKEGFWDIVMHIPLMPTVRASRNG